MQNGNSKCKDKKFIKYSVNLKESLPSTVKIFTDQSYVNEDLALSELINEADCIEGNIVVFDRGLQSRRSFDKFTNSNKLFVSRSKISTRCKVESHKEIAVKPVAGTVTIISDETRFFIGRKEKKTQHQYRIINATIDKSGEKICFVTNIIDEDCYVIAE